MRRSINIKDNAGWVAFVQRRQRYLALSPASKAKMAEWEKARDDAAYADWLAAGAPDPLEDLIAKRKTEREAAELEMGAIDRACRKVCMAANSTDEEVEAAEVQHAAATAAWHVKYDHLWPAASLAKAKKCLEADQQTYFARIKEFEMSVLPFPTPAAPLPDLLKSSAEFVRGFEPPDYLVDGILQRRYFYSLTAQTGVGKTAIAMRLSCHVAAGRPLGDVSVEQGTVLYFAGENPSDVQARHLGVTRNMSIDPATADIHFLAGAMDLSLVAERISAEVAVKGLRLALVVVDTAAAYNFGSEDENSNTQAGAYARQLRSLTLLPGGPAVLVLCHPTKRAGEDDLIPRGGGAFLAEVDGNIAVQKKDTLLVASAQGKFRGSDAWALRFELETMRDHPTLKDTRGRFIPTVIAKPVGESAAAVMEQRTDMDDERVLRAVSNAQGSSPTDLARALGWTYGARAEPNQTKAARVLRRLLKAKLVVERLGAWRTTQTGDRELNAIDMARPVLR